jgi:hypothetical protein
MADPAQVVRMKYLGAGFCSFLEAVFSKSKQRFHFEKTIFKLGATL